MIPTEPIAHLSKYGPRVAVYPGPNRQLEHLFPLRYHNVVGAHQETAFTIPFDIALKAPAIFKKAFPDERITMDASLSAEIERILSIERQSVELSIATDADLTLGVLSLEPRNFQRAATAFGMVQKSFLNSLEMGLGKTLVACWIAEYEKLPTLWLTKAALVLNLDCEIRKLTGKKVCIFSGRIPAQNDLGYLLSGDFDHFIINYEVIGSETKEKDVNGKETVRRLWPEIFNIAAKFGKLKLVIADEVHVCKSMETLRTKALMDLEIDRRIPMTGTAITNKLDDLWTILHWIDRKRFANKAGFLSMYARWDGAVRDPAKLQADLSPYIFRRRKRDVLKDLPELIRIPHTIELEGSHKERYALALAGIYETLDGGQTDIVSQLAALNRLRQIVADAKAEATIEYVQNLLEEDPEAKVIVFSNFTDPVLRIAKALRCEAVWGNTPQLTRMQYCDAFNQRPYIRCISMAMQVGQEGLNLTGATHIVHNDYWWNPAAHEQANARAYGRLNDLHGVTTTQVTALKTIDDIIEQIHVRKQGLTDVVDGMNDQNESTRGIIREVMQWIRDNRQELGGWTGSVGSL